MKYTEMLRRTMAMFLGIVLIAAPCFFIEECTPSG